MHTSNPSCTRANNSQAGTVKYLINKDLFIYFKYYHVSFPTGDNIRRYVKLVLLSPEAKQN
jgi:hypothetical protein